MNTGYITRRSIVNRLSRPVLACGLGLLMVGLFVTLLSLPVDAMSPSAAAQSEETIGPSPTESQATALITRTPLIFVPGIQGSRLFNTVDSHEYEVWLKWTNILPILENRLDVLRLAADGEAPLRPDDPAYNTVHTKPGKEGLVTDIPIDVRDIIPWWPWDPLMDITIYKEILAYFASRGYTETVDFWVYTYDWRKGLPQAADGLDTLINQVRTQTGQSKVYIVAHSMGGLVTRTYISDPARAAKVKRLMTLGTPYLGTPQSAYALLEGSCMKGLFSIDLYPLVPIRVCLPSMKKTTELVTNMTGFYSLFPARSYFTVKGGGYYGMSDRPNPSGACPSCLSFTDTYKTNVLPGLNTGIFASADALHSQIDAQPGETWNDVPVDIVVGNGEATTAGVYPQKRFSPIPPFWRTIYVEVIDKYGDGTVTLFSASMSNVANEQNLRGEASYKEFPDDHIGLTKDCLVWVYIDHRLGLTGPDPCTIPVAHQRSADDVIITPLAQIVGFNVKSIEAVDHLGRRTGPLTATVAYEAEIPGSRYDVQEGMASITLRGGVPYTITVEPTGQGAVDLMTWNNTLSDTVTTTFHAGIVATAQGRLYLIGDPFETDQWLVDPDGNGPPESVPPPAVYADGVAQDRIPPMTTVTISGTVGPQGWYTQPVTVTLSASDGENGAGVSRIEYFFSYDRTVRQYERPFVAEPWQGVLYVFATDRAINQHEPLAVRIGPDRTWLPVVIK